MLECVQTNSFDHKFNFSGERSETVNVHNLTHLAEQVKVMGPLWTHSAFGFEAMIAHTLKGFKGTRGVPEQVQ